MTDEKIGDESRSFVCVDSSGNKVTVIAEREIIQALTGVRFGPWLYRTEDNRRVRPGPHEGEYVLVSGNIPLTTIDPNEPMDVPAE